MIAARLVLPLCGLWLMVAVGRGLAQQPKFLPLQPHKLQWAQQVLKDAKAKKDSLMLAEAYYLFGKTYEASGDYLTAKRYFMQSLRILEPRGDSEELSRLYVRLADLGFFFYNYADDLRYARLAVAVAERIRSDKALLRAYSKMKQTHEIDWSQMPGQANKSLPKPNYDSVLYYLKKIEPLARRSPDPIELAVVNQYLGAELLRRNDPKAIAYWEEALKIYTKQKKTADQVNAMLGLAGVYVHFGQPQRAKELLTKAEQLWQTLPSTNAQGTRFGFEGTYTHYYQAIGDWKRAFEHQRKAFDLERNRYLADREGAVSRLSVEYETEKKEAQLKNQQKELALSTENLKNQRRFLVAVSALFLLAVGGIVVFYRLYRQNQRISRRNAELVKEQNHRVKNNLQVVSSLLSLQSNRLADEVAKQAVEESQLRVEAMAILHRRLYDGEGLVVVNLTEFMTELVQNVLRTFGYDAVEPEYDIDPVEIAADPALRLGLIINELTTNACKYAFVDNPSPIFRVACHLNDQEVELTVADNGPGFVHSTQSLKSFGMRLVQMQVEQLNGTYRFHSEQGTKFWMRFRV